MKKTRLKHNADGSLTVYVPRGQVPLFEWIIQEGEAGLALMSGGEDDAVKSYKSNSIETRQEWRGFTTD